MNKIFILNIPNILVKYIPSFAPEGQQGHQVGDVGGWGQPLYFCMFFFKG